MFKTSLQTHFFFTDVFCGRNGKCKFLHLPKGRKNGNVPVKCTCASLCHALPSAKATAVFFIIPHRPLEFVQLIKIYLSISCMVATKLATFFSVKQTWAFAFRTGWWLFHFQILFLHQASGRGRKKWKKKRTAVYFRAVRETMVLNKSLLRSFNFW